jgi:hypothetical protein
MEMQQRPTAENIIQQDAEKNGEDFDAVYQAIQQGVQRGDIRVVRHNNTLLVYRILKKGVAEIHLYSIDQPPEIIEAFKNFYQAFKVAGFKTVYSIVENPQIIRLIKMARIPVQSQDGQHIMIEVK